jgi:hypothetical protein
VRGAVILGTAEGGRKVVLTDVNNFRIKGMPGYSLDDTTNVKRVFETIQHEYAHILDQIFRCLLNLVLTVPARTQLIG